MELSPHTDLSPSDLLWIHIIKVSVVTSKKETQRAAGRAEHEHNATEDAQTGCGDTRVTSSRTTGESAPTVELQDQIRSLIREVLIEPEFAGKFRRKKGT